MDWILYLDCHVRGSKRCFEQLVPCGPHYERVTHCARGTHYFPVCKDGKHSKVRHHTLTSKYFLKRFRASQIYYSQTLTQTLDTISKSEKWGFLKCLFDFLDFLSRTHTLSSSNRFLLIRQQQQIISRKTNYK